MSDETPKRIDFEDVTTEEWSAVPKGYRGLEWENFQVFRRSFSPDSGYALGIVTGDYVARNRCGKPCAIASATPFSVASFRTTAAWNKDLKLLIEGLDGGGDVTGSYETVLGDPREGPTLVDLKGVEGSFEGIRKLRITTSGGESAALNVKLFVKKGPYDRPLSTPVPTHSTAIAVDDLVIY